MKKLVLISAFLFLFSNLYGQNNRYICVDDNVNIRKEPSIQSEIIGKANIGKILYGNYADDEQETINDIKSYWINVIIPGKGNGYIWGQYLKPIIEKIIISGIEIVLFPKEYKYSSLSSVLFSDSDVYYLFGRKIYKIQFDKSEIKKFSSIKLYDLGGNKCILLKEYAWGDGGSYIDNSEIYNFSLYDGLAYRIGKRLDQEKS